jgi:hypothetical protein
MTLKEACTAAREISNKITDRVYVVKTGQSFEFIEANSLPEETTPAGVAAYTWYQVRSRQVNKWSIQEL